MKIVLTADEFFSMVQKGKSSREDCRVFVEHDGSESDVGTYSEVSKMLHGVAFRKAKEAKKKAKVTKAKAKANKVAVEVVPEASASKKEKHYKRRRKKHATPKRDIYNRGRNVLPFKHYSEDDKKQLDKFFKTKSNHYTNGSIMFSKVKEFAKEIGRTPAAVLVYFSTHGYRSHRYKGTIQIPTGGKQK